MEYRPYVPDDVIRVDSIVTVHYFQFARGYVFHGERHAFWEIVYMDRGGAELGADGWRFPLGEGEVAFHKPGEFHTIWAGGSKAPDIVVISFVSLSAAMERFAGVHMRVDEECKRLIAQILVEAKNAWTNKLDSDYHELIGRKGGPAGAAQMVRVSLEALLVRLLRTLDGRPECPTNPDGAPVRPKTEAGRREYLDGLAEEIEAYISDHLDEKFTIPLLCLRFNMSGTSLKRLFKARTGGGVMRAIGEMRHDRAKRHIREGMLNMSAIAEKCGYGSVHYFSRRFAKMEGMTPSEYARSVKSMTE